LTVISQAATTLLIRADASVTMGTGHVMRCLALAQAWQDVGQQAIFAMADSTPPVRERLRSEGLRVAEVSGEGGSECDLTQTAELARKEHAPVVVVDGYQFSAHYLRSLKDAGLKVALLDDNGRAGRLSVDLVLNQNIHAHEGIYENRETYTKLLLGTKYILLRREFAGWRGYQRQIRPAGCNLLVAMGGSDPDNVTLRVIEAIDHVDIAELNVAVLLGGSNPHKASISERIGKARCEYRVLADATNMPELIAAADLAVSAAGTASWEYCLLGLPAVLVAIAENQIPAATALHNLTAAVLLEGGTRFPTDKMSALIGQLMNSGKERQSLSRNSQAIVDGKGASRVVSALLSGNLSSGEGA
jgi:UDP-2,4-diacetamido-2,4,6-trideoxy-beta-L-altropyranose hydrolase